MKNRVSQIIIAGLVIVGTAACAVQPTPVTQTSATRALTSAAATPATSVAPFSPEAYVSEALDIMQKYSINRKRVNWSALRAKVVQQVHGARTPGETYFYITAALTELGDHH